MNRDVVLPFRGSAAWISFTRVSGFDALGGFRRFWLLRPRDGRCPGGGQEQMAFCGKPVLFGVVGTVESAKPSHSRRVDDFAWLMKNLKGAMVSDRPSDRKGTGRRCHSHFAGDPPLWQDLRRHQFCLPIGPRITTARPPTVAPKAFSHVQLNAKPETPLISKPSKIRGSCSFLRRAERTAMNGAQLSRLTEILWDG
jgi:hypothetical protein